MTIKEIRQQFYTFRNGIIADTLRKAGDPHRIIFGLNLPQITDIARLIGLDASLARELWADTSCREAQLLAPMIMPSDAIGQNDALKMIKECGFQPDVRIYRKKYAPRSVKDLQRWCNNRIIYRTTPNFWEYAPRSDGKTMKETYPKHYQEWIEYQKEKDSTF